MKNLNLKRPIIFFDLETTGTDIMLDRIVQIAALRMNPDGTRVEKNILINPDRSIPKDASDVHGITNEMVEGLPKFEKYAVSIKSFFTDCDLGGYNSNRFDVPLLMQELNRCGLTLDVSNISLVDVMQIETKINPRTLGAVYQRYTGKVLENAHDALADVLATAEILEKQLLTEDLENMDSFEELDLFSQGDSPRVDVSGKLCKSGDEICWTFGKNKGMPILQDRGYLNWFLKQSVPVDTREIIDNLLTRI